jgi:hypothetical protein
MDIIFFKKNWVRTISFNSIQFINIMIIINTIFLMCMLCGDWKIESCLYIYIYIWSIMYDFSFIGGSPWSPLLEFRGMIMKINQYINIRQSIDITNQRHKLHYHNIDIASPINPLFYFILKKNISINHIFIPFY